jgi:hypothetical protein
MITLEYPKIETLYNRDDKFKVITTDVRFPEFSYINTWVLTEKVDGTNVRIALHSDGSIEYGGRTKDAQMPTFLLSYLQETFTKEKLHAVFEKPEGFPEVVIFGEGYGPKIQKGGNYSNTVGFRLFDCAIAGEAVCGWWWMETDFLDTLATSLQIARVPFCGGIKYLPTSCEDLERLLPNSIVTIQDKGQGTYLPEGIVARPPVTMFSRNGHRIMWKLKYRDF